MSAPRLSPWVSIFELLKLSIPMIISQGAFALMIFTDRYFMSEISPLHMASALGGGVTSFLCLSFFIGLISYANAMIAQYYGAEDFSKCAKVVTIACFLVLIFTPLIWVLGYGSSYLFSWLGHPEEQIVLEKAYLFILQTGAGFTLIKIVFACFFVGISRSKVVMLIDTFGVIINIPLSYILINGFSYIQPLGIIGAGLGTLISNILVVLLYAALYFNLNNRNKFFIDNSFILHRGILKRYLRLGIPSGIELFLNIAAFNLFLLMFQSLGIVEGASAAIIFNWDILSFVPISGLAIALISMSGQQLGANNLSAISGTIRSGFAIAISYSALLALVFFIFKAPMIKMFIHNTQDSETIYALTEYMMMGLISYLIADATIQVSSAILRGTGDTRWLMLTSISLHWLMLLSQFIMIKVFHMNSKASWLAFVVMIISMAIIYLIRLSQRRWLHSDVRAHVMQEL